MPKAQDTPPDPESLSYEQAVEELEAIVERIESGEASLEESMKLYERGTKLLRRCRGVLDQAEQKLSELDAATLAREGE
ncbi:MAG: exodeoxyribonuclease VII small subunit [Phycisphaerales bacterium]|nr:exodeoxyribonuclease VII small subunit [Phycisphaerales bacterium]